MSVAPMSLKLQAHRRKKKIGIIIIGDKPELGTVDNLQLKTKCNFIQIPFKVCFTREGDYGFRNLFVIGN